MQLLTVLQYAALVAAAPSTKRPADNIKCPIIFDGRITKNLTLASFDSATTSPFNPDFVKGENTTWSSILLFPSCPAPSRFDNARLHKPLEVTIDDRSLFRAGDNLQVGFRRAGLLLKDDANDPGADASDSGIVTFHWSTKQDPKRGWNFTHEYMNVWHERADYNGNQFTFVSGLVLPGDGGNGIDTQEERQKFRIQDRQLNTIFSTPVLFDAWQNFAVQLDYSGNGTIKAFYSAGDRPLEAVTAALPNDNTGGGQIQIGIAKKPTETETVVYDGYQEHIPLRGEGALYGGIFVEKSDGGCVSL